MLSNNIIESLDNMRVNPYLPIEVEMRELEGESLHLVNGQLRRVLQHIISGRSDSPLGHFL